MTITISMGQDTKKKSNLNLVLAQALITASIPAQNLTVILALIIVSLLRVHHHHAQTLKVTRGLACA